jgi:KaiC/GvpD/RAD55 family RecA-like ATPase
MILEKIPQSSAVVIISPPLEGKEILVNSGIKDKLKEKIPILIISTDKSAEDFKNELVKEKIFFGDAETKGFLAFIDCYSMHVGEAVKNTPSIKRVPGPLALNEISVALSDIEKEFFRKSPKHCIIFSSLSTMLMYSNPQAIGRFVQVVIAKIKKAGGSIFFTLEEGMHTPDVIVMMEHMMDYIVFVKRENGKLFVKAKGLGGFEDWDEFKA